MRTHTWVTSVPFAALPAFGSTVGARRTVCLFSKGQVFALHFLMMRLRTGECCSIVTTNEKGQWADYGHAP